MVEPEVESGADTPATGAAAPLPEQSPVPDEGPKAEPWNMLPVRALLLSVPAPEDVPLLCDFIRDTLPREAVNTLVLRIKYSYQFASHPELADENALSKEELIQIREACKAAGVKLVPKMNLLGHQSEEGTILPLLAQYPQFDESPDLNPPVPWRYGGLHDFYCKSLCPLHPDLYPILFALMDELIDVCEADTFHAGLDEVWIIGHDKCPRCGGRDKAELFAYLTTKLHDHLAERGCRMWIWSDRLIDGKTTNLLGWQASMNNTHRAIDLIPKDVVICDWKYEDAAPTPIYFAIKGFDVLTSPCYSAEAALAQLELISLVRKNGTRAFFSPQIANHMIGMFATSWVSARVFIEAYHATEPPADPKAELAYNTTSAFKALFAQIRQNAV